MEDLNKYLLSLDIEEDDIKKKDSENIYYLSTNRLKYLYNVFVYLIREISLSGSEEMYINSEVVKEIRREDYDNLVSKIEKLKKSNYISENEAKFLLYLIGLEIKRIVSIMEHSYLFFFYALQYSLFKPNDLFEKIPDIKLFTKGNVENYDVFENKMFNIPYEDIFVEFAQKDGTKIVGDSIKIDVKSGDNILFSRILKEYKDANSKEVVEYVNKLKSDLVTKGVKFDTIDIVPIVDSYYWRLEKGKKPVIYDMNGYCYNPYLLRILSKSENMINHLINDKTSYIVYSGDIEDEVKCNVNYYNGGVIIDFENITHRENLENIFNEIFLVDIGLVKNILDSYQVDDDKINSKIYFMSKCKTENYGMIKLEIKDSFISKCVIIFKIEDEIKYYKDMYIRDSFNKKYVIRLDKFERDNSVVLYDIYKTMKEYKYCEEVKDSFVRYDNKRVIKLNYIDRYKYFYDSEVKWELKDLFYSYEALKEFYELMIRDENVSFSTATLIYNKSNKVLEIWEILFYYKGERYYMYLNLLNGDFCISKEKLNRLWKIRDNFKNISQILSLYRYSEDFVVRVIQSALVDLNEKVDLEYKNSIREKIEEEELDEEEEIDLEEFDEYRYAEEFDSEMCNKISKKYGNEILDRYILFTNFKKCNITDEMGYDRMKLYFDYKNYDCFVIKDKKIADYYKVRKNYIEV